MAHFDGERKRRSLTHTNRTASEAPRGLPWEVWQLVFSHLKASDLCHASQVCRTWKNLVESLDASRWREIYQDSTEWKLPNWPLSPDTRPPSWKQALKEQVLQTRFWYHGNILVDQTQCLGAFRRQRGSYWRRKTIVVGRDGEHDTLKSALSVANDYDRILVKPGIYDEQFEMSSKIPLELVGDGELGSVILVMCVEQTSITGRLCNLVIRAPWFTSFALKVKAGYIQVDNCIIEDGLVLIQNPGSGHFRFCTFRHANVILQHVNVSILENCEFSQCDLAAVSIEGFPKDEVNWAHGHMTYITAVTKETICKDYWEQSRSQSSFSLGTKSSDCQEVLNEAVGYHNDKGQGLLGEEDGVSVSSSTVIRNVSHWLNNAVESGSQLTLTTEDPPVDPQLHCLGNVNISCNLVRSDSDSRKCDKTETISLVQSHVGRGSHQNVHVSDAEASHKKTGEFLAKECENCSDKTSTARASLCHKCSYDETEGGLGLSGITDGSSAGEKQGAKHAYSHPKGMKHNCNNAPELEQLNASVAATNEAVKPKNSKPESKLALSMPKIPRSQLMSFSSLSSSDSTKAHSAGSRLHRTSRLANSTTGSLKPDNPLVLDDISDATVDDGDGDDYLNTGVFEQLEISDDIDDAAGSSTSKSFPNKAYTTVKAAEAWLNPHAETVAVDVHKPHSEVSNRVEDPTMRNDPLNRPADLMNMDDLPSPENAFAGFENVVIHEDQADGEFVLDDLSSEDSSDTERGNSSTLSSTSDAETFSHSETSLSDEEMLVRMSYPHHHRALLSRKRNSTQVDLAAVSKQVSLGEKATLRGESFMELLEDAEIVRAIEEVQGVTIRNCRMNNGKGGVMVSCQGHVRVIGCHIANMGYGIRCVQNSRALVLKNEIHHCRTSGIFMRLAASGVIAGNDIHSNMEAGIDVRKNADPIIQGNQIHHGERFGVAVLCSGQGQIRNNDIYANAEAGIYILYRGNPLISENRLMKNQAAGISVNENGLGMIKDNMISGNMWAGVYIRYGGDPFVQNNVICNGVADGVVVGEKGRGTVSKNTVTGNAGCGVWIMGGECPLLHGNTISNNGDAGIAFVTTGPMSSEPGVRVQGSQAHSPASLALQELLIDDEKRETKPHYSQTKVVHNTLCHNTGHGISVESGKDVFLGSNNIYGNNQSGIYINHPKLVTVHSNHISCNQLAGVSTGAIGQTNIIGNGIFDNKTDGICCQNEAVIKENDVISSQSDYSGIALKGTNEIKIEKNRVYSRDHVISLTESVRGLVQDNQMYSSQGSPIVMKSVSKVKVVDNQLIPVESSPAGTLPQLPWKPGEPASRPFVQEPGDLPIQAPARYVRSVARVTVLESGNCQGGSRTCILV